MRNPDNMVNVTVCFKYKISNADNTVNVTVCFKYKISNPDNRVNSRVVIIQGLGFYKNYYTQKPVN